MTETRPVGGRCLAATALVISLLCAVPASGQEPLRERPKTETAAPTDAQIDAAILGLGSAEYAERVGAEKLLRRAGESARGALKRATESADPEVRHRARRLLGALEQPAQPVKEKGRPEESEGGLRRVKPRTGAGQRGRGGEPQRDPGSELQQRLDELFRQLEQGGPIFDGRTIDPGRLLRDMDLGGLRRSSGTSVQVGPDGVRVEVTERDENGKPQKKVYEAETVEQLREKHPDIADRFFGSGTGGIRLEMPTPLRPRGLTPSNPGGRDRSPVDLPPASGPRLGVMVAPLEPQLADYLGLAPERGLYVSEVVQGSLAETLGVQTKDVLLRVAGVELRQIRDVGAALQEVKPGETLVVSLIRRGKRMTLETEAPVLAPSKEQVLRRRPKDPAAGGGERR